MKIFLGSDHNGFHLKEDVFAYLVKRGHDVEDVGDEVLDTTVITPTKQVVEFQVRSTQMHEYAERGLAASFHYNEQKQAKDYKKKRGTSTLPAQLQWILQMQEVADKLSEGDEVAFDELRVDLFDQRIFCVFAKGRYL